MTRALVLGGTGFIGAAACKELMRRGVETVAASRTPHPFGTFTSHRAFDRSDEEQLAAALNDVQPDVVLDLACYQAAQMAAVARLFQGQRYVFVSTGSVYPELEGRPAREDDFRPLKGEPPTGDLSYADGKRWCETLLARGSGAAWTVIRPPAVFGAGDHTLRIAAYLQRVEDGGPLLVPAETYRRPLALAWSKDVGFACALACDPRKAVDGQAFNVGFEGVSLESLLQALGRAMGREVRLKQMPYASLPPGASPYGPDPRRPSAYVIERAREELGFEPSALEDALAETLAWYRVGRPSHPGYSARKKELELAEQPTQ